jgi:predicted metal-dependent phosphoesterase TrpH
MSTPEQIVQHCLEVDIDCLAVTDHNTISGALEMRRIAPFTIIVGEEMLTTHGEIMGLFLSEEIPRGLSPEDTVARIKGQGGLVCIPHPRDRFRPFSRLRRDAFEKVKPDIDLIEVFNSRTWLQRDSAQARKLAHDLGVPGTAGSDAHVATEIGRAYVELPEFDDVEGFRTAIAQGQVHGSRTGMLVHFHNPRNRIIKRLKRS